MDWHQRGGCSPQIVLLLVTMLATIYTPTAGQVIESWSCECSGYTYSLPSELPHWPVGGRSHTAASASCAIDGATLPSTLGDMTCFTEYAEYLYHHYNLTAEGTRLWLNSPTGNPCVAFYGCSTTLQPCEVTLRYMCQKINAGHNPVTPHVPNAVASDPTPLPNIGVSYTCNSGYEPSGAAPYTSQCTGAKYWSVPSLTCSAISCPALPAPENGAVTFTDSFFYLSVARFTCSAGYNLGGDASAFCQADRTWNTTTVTCTVIDCGPPPIIANSRVSYMDTVYGSIADYTCTPGYHAPSDKTTFFITVCQASTTWNTTGVLCQALDCGRPPLFPNTVLTYDKTDFQAVAAYTCTAGHAPALNASAPYEAICSANGLWEDNGIDCRPVDCGTPPSLPNSDVSYPDTKYLSMATYICHVGYRNSTFLHTALCQANEQWSSENIGCEAVDCGPPPTHPNTIVDVTTTTYQSTARYFCTDGHERPDGEPTPFVTTCTASGVWQSVDVTCQATHCPDQESPSNGFIAFSNGTLYQSVIKFACNAGYQLDGNDFLQCQIDKTWDNAAPVCASLVHCPAVQVPENGNVTHLLGEENEVNSVLAFSCRYGYRVNGSSTLVCTAQGTWSGNFPTCQDMGLVPTTPAETSTPAKQSALEPTDISTIVLAIVVLILVLAAVLVVWRLKRTGNRRYSFFTDARDENLTSSGRQLTESTRENSQGGGMPSHGRGTAEKTSLLH